MINSRMIISNVILLLRTDHSAANHSVKALWLRRCRARLSVANSLHAQFLPKPAQPLPGSVFDNYTPPPYAGVLAELRNHAEQDDANSQYALGHILFYGLLDVPVNKSKAAAWWHKAAEQGHARAQNDLGVMYETGDGESQDIGKAAKRYRLSAEQGYARAQNNLGVLLQSGKGLPQNGTEAVIWFRKAAEQDYPDAQRSLAYMYANGIGIETNLVEAMA